MLTIKYLGMIADITHKDSEEMPMPPTVGQAMERLRRLYPELGSASFRIAVNHRFVDGQEPLKAGDELALLPPFAGG